MSDQDQDFPPPQGAAWSPPETVAGGWRPGGGPGASNQGPAAAAGPLRPEDQHHTRTRVAVTIAALVTTLGAVVLGFALTSGHGASSATTSNAAGRPNVAVDPPSSAASARSGAAAVPSGSPTATLSVPPAPPTLDPSAAMASAQAVEGAFAPPSSVPSDVRPYSGSAALSAVVIPPFLNVQLPSVQAKDQGAQALADESALMVRAWVEAWASGLTSDARYDALCVDQCRTVMDPTIKLWKNANIIPAGTLRFFNLAGGLAKGNARSGEVGLCLDDSGLTAMRNGAQYVNPYPMAKPELLVFGLVYDQAVGHWVASEAYTSPGDSYCAQDAGSAS